MIEPRDEELSRIYRDAQAPNPPQRVEDNILAASRRVAGVGPRPAGAGFARRWGTPVALAATVVVTFTLALVAFEQRSGPDIMTSEAPVGDRPSNVFPAEPKLADRLEKPPPAELQPVAPTPASPPAALRRDRVPPLATGQPAFVPEVPRTSEVLRMREEAKPAPAAPTPGASVYPTEPPGAGQAAPLQNVPGAEARTRQSAGAAGGLSREAAVADARERAPDKWLEDIRNLRTQGKTTEVERELAEFKKRYPDYRLPEDLR